MQEQRSREAKKAEVTLVPTQVAQLSMAGEARRGDRSAARVTVRRSGSNQTHAERQAGEEEEETRLSCFDSTRLHQHSTAAASGGE